MADKEALETGADLVVAIAWHQVGEDGEERTLLDEDGEDVPDLDEVVVGAFTSERLAIIGSEAYVVDYKKSHDPESGGHGPIAYITLHATTLDQHGVGYWRGRLDVTTGVWENAES